MNDLGEIDLYKEDPNRLCRDANDLKMKIEYAKENGVAYKENGKYKKFLNIQLYLLFLVLYIEIKELNLLFPSFFFLFQKDSICLIFQLYP